MERIEKSNDIGELVKALVKVQSELKHPKKDKDNPFFKSKYADLTQIVETCRPVLQENGFAVAQPCGVNEQGETVLITYLLHESGQFIRGELKLNPEKNTPQGFGSAITYARRYCLASMVGIAPEDDDDDAEAAEGRGNRIKEEIDPLDKPVKKPIKKYTKDEQKHIGDPDYVCSECDAPIDDRVLNFSMGRFGKALCRDCQKAEVTAGGE